MKKTTPRALVFVATFALTIGASILGATPAFAITPPSGDGATSSVEWEGITYEDGGSIADAAIRDYVTGVYGWNLNSLATYPDRAIFPNIFPSPFVLSAGGQDVNFNADSAATPVWNPGGTNIFSATDEMALGPDSYSVTLVLTLRGNFAQWTASITPIGAASLTGVTGTFAGNLASGAQAHFVNEGATLIADDTGGATPGIAGARDPIIVQNATTDGTFNGWTAADGAPRVSVSQTGGSHFQVTLALVGFNPCDGFQQAMSFAQSIASTLPEHFGESYVTFGNSCLTFAPVELQPGVAFSQSLDYAIDPALSDYGYFAGPPDFGELQAVVTGLPEGVTATAVQDPATGAVNISLTGTPTTPGSHVATVFFSAALNDSSWWAPLTATIPITVAVPTLAATGLDQRGILVAAGFLLLAGWAIARNRRARRR